MQSDKEYDDASRIAELFRRALERAGSVKDIADIVSEAKSQAGTGTWAYLVYPGIYNWAMDRAYYLDPDCKISLQLEQDWIAAYAETAFSIHPSLVEHKRSESEYWRVLRPMADRHDELCTKATSPVDLLSIVTDVTSKPPLQMDDRFRTAALCSAYEAAWLLDPDDPTTKAIAKKLDQYSGQGVSQMVAKEAAREKRKLAKKSAKK